MLESLMENRKKIIFSSCYLPADIPKLNDKLRSCLASGLVSIIEPPDFSMRLRILKRKCRCNGQRVPEEVLHFLASELTEDIRLLESGLIGVVAKSSLMATPIDLHLAESVVRNIALSRKKITVESIKKLVCRQFKVSVGDVTSRSRKQCFVRPRQIAIYLSRRYTDASLQAIGKSFNRYHATALHSIAAVEKDMKVNPATRRQVEILSRQLETGDF
jgi:chromosomal replication initiator protein